MRVGKPALVEAAVEVGHPVEVGSQSDIGAGLAHSECPKRRRPDLRAVKEHERLPCRRIDDARDMGRDGSPSEARRPADCD